MGKLVRGFKTFSQSAPGIVTWANLDNLAAVDGLYASSAGPVAPGDRMYELIGKGAPAGQELPADAVIQGIRFGVLVYAEPMEAADVYPICESVRLYKCGALLGNVPAADLVPVGEVNIAFLYVGGESELFATTWTPAELDDDGSGAGFCLYLDDPSMTAVLFHVDFLQTEVWYTLAEEPAGRLITPARIGGRPRRVLVGPGGMRRW